VISDTHYPYNHPDILSFLKTIKKELKPTRVIHIGDEVDYHAISFHDSDPDLMSPNDELETAIKRLKAVYDLFPEMDIVESNHGSLVYRKGKHHGLPRSVFKSYREILEAPLGWKWHFDLTLTLPNKQKVFFCHGKSKNAMKLSQSMGMSTVNGHYHEDFSVQYWANPNGLYWAMVVGCLIEPKSLAYAYNNSNLKRPIIGLGFIENSHPKLIPMVLDKKGRWIGRLV
jgi:hypothetical protein